MIDAHFHIWRPSRGDYGWLDAQKNPALAPICRNVSVLDWQQQSRRHGIQAGIVVQAAPTEEETLFLLAQADANDAILGVVGWVDWLAPQAPARVAALAQHPKLKGLRPMLQDLPDPGWILQPALAPVLQAMERSGLVLDLLVRSEHLPHIQNLVQRYPSLSMVLDHGGKPGIAGLEWQPWAEQIEALAQYQTLACKLSGLRTEAAAGAPAGACDRWAKHLLACFGPDRILWGSDWPVLELNGSYALWWQETTALLAAFHAPQRANMLGGNARRIYKL